MLSVETLLCARSVGPVPRTLPGGGASCPSPCAHPNDGPPVASSRLTWTVSASHPVSQEMWPLREGCRHTLQPPAGGIQELHMWASCCCFLGCVFVPVGG